MFSKPGVELRKATNQIPSINSEPAQFELGQGPNKYLVSLYECELDTS